MRGFTSKEDIANRGLANAALEDQDVAEPPVSNQHDGQCGHHREQAEGTTIVQVTHSEENARYGHRIVRLRDGWISGEEKVADRIGAAVTAAYSGQTPASPFSS